MFNADNCLPQSQVTCVFQDSYGFLWVGTQDGLAYYDGYEFKSFSHNPMDSLSIANSYIYSIVEDENNNIWVGTRAGVSLFLRADGNFKNYYLDYDNISLSSSSIVYSIVVDRNGGIWIKTIDALHLYLSDTDNFIRFPLFNNKLNITLELDNSPIIEDSEGTIWVGTNDGLFQFDKEAQSFTRIEIDCTKSERCNSVISLFEDSKNQVWVGTRDGLFRYNSKLQKAEPFKSSKRSKILGNIIEFIGEDFDQSLWVGTESALNIIDTKGSINSFSEVMTNGRVISVGDIKSVIRDRSKVLWIGTRSGLIKWSYYNQRFKSFSKDVNGKNLFSSNIVVSLHTDSDGSIWVGTWGTGLFRFNKTDGVIDQYSSNSSNRKIDDDYVHVIFKTSNGSMLIGTRNGVMSLNNKILQFNRFLVKGSVNPFINNRVYAIDEDLEGNIWFATGSGLYRVDTMGYVTSFLQNSEDSLRILSSEVRDVLVDSKGYIWAATTRGLNCLKATGKVIASYTKVLHNTHSFRANHLMCLHEDKIGNIWVGTRTGLHKFDTNTKEFSVFSDNLNLVNGLVYSIEEDSNRRLWLSTNRGLVLLNPEANFVRVFSTNDGLLSNEFNLGASHKSANGDLLFGTIDGFNSFNPDSISLNYQHPQVSITRIEVMDKNGDIQMFSPNSPSIKITEGFKYLNIEFSSFDFNFPDRNEYRYVIEGYDDSWIDLGSKHTVLFTNLKERTYLFKVLGSNSDNIWSKEPQTLKIVVSAPFWRSRIALILYFIAVLGVILVYLVSRRRNLAKINKLLKEREFVLNELEEQKMELEITNKNITDSIHYAKRIQEAIMPSISVFKSILPDSFILNMPKDIVSGDFYWINETQNKIFIAVCDCTGHGVPGAFMSIIGIELLRNITTNEGLNDAAEILNRLSVSIYETFSSGINESGYKVKDGMDVAFCVIDREYNTLQYAGAFSNLFILRDGKIIEISGDRNFVGSATDEGNMLFSSSYVPLQPDDMIYMLTDGYVDQFGGIEGKKFKLRRFRRLLLNIHRLPMELQQKYLYDTIISWKGMQDQVDDILVIGIRPDLSCMF